MKSLTLIIGALVANSLMAGNGWAQTAKTLDITMTIVDESDSPNEIINRIELPPANTFSLNNSVEPSSTATDNSEITNRLDQVQDDVQQATGNLVEGTNEVLTNTINDALSTGDVEQLPGDIIENLPDELPNDLLPIPLPGDLTPNPNDLPIEVPGVSPLTSPIETPIESPIDTSLGNPLENAIDSTPNLDEAMDSIGDDLQQQPDAINQIPDATVPLPDQSQLLDDIAPLQP